MVIEHCRHRMVGYCKPCLAEHDAHLRGAPAATEGRGACPVCGLDTGAARARVAESVLSAVETLKATGGAVEIDGVKIYPCDSHGRIPADSPVDYQPEEPIEDRSGAPEPKRTRLYTAGCISGDDRPFDEKAAVFYEGAEALRDKGFEAVNPLDIGNDLCFHGEDACHDNTLRRLKGKDQGAGQSWYCYLRHDLIEVLRCDGVALLPGWEQSPGARMEFDVATRVGIPAKPLREWLDERRTVVGVDPATGGSVRVDGDGVFTILSANEISVHHKEVCARCGGTDREHGPGGSRSYCAFAGRDTGDRCALCGHLIVWDGQRWQRPSPEPGGWSAVCTASARPDVAHEPAGTGEQR
jgi:hypothetical protein